MPELSQQPHPFETSPLTTRYLTHDLPGIGGIIKVRPEDFVVQEIPLYEPSGSGEHLYLYIEKIGRPTLEVVRQIAKAFNVKQRDIGYAGMKDKQAITRQVISVHTFDDSPIHNLDIHGVEVLSANRHGNKLRLGHLRGNRFVIKIRDVNPTDVILARSILNTLATRGIPNSFGPQRFGVNQNNHAIGRRFLLQDWQGMCDLLLGQPIDPTDPAYAAQLAFAEKRYKDAAMLWPKSAMVEKRIAERLAKNGSHEYAITEAPFATLRFFVTAFQSAIFNKLVDARLHYDLLETLIQGDLAWKHNNGSVFAVTQSELDNPALTERINDLEISPSGPLWGYEMTTATSQTGEAERNQLDATGVDLESFVTPPHHVRGARRPLRIPVTEAGIEAGVDAHGGYVQLQFRLPRGSFATTLLAEIMKVNP